MYSKTYLTKHGGRLGEDISKGSSPNVTWIYGKPIDNLNQDIVHVFNSQK